MKYSKRSQYQHAKSQYRVRNWPEYEAGLKKRGDLTVWLSGIASARACLRRGHRIIGIEHADDFGGVWHPSRRYPGIQTQSPKGLYCYTDAPMPED